MVKYDSLEQPIYKKVVPTVATDSSVPLFVGKEVKTWEETVLTKEQLRAINDAMPSEAKYGDVHTAIAEAQAKIAFEAGRESRDHEIAEAKRTGMREVVEWVEHSGIPYQSALDDWQDYKKEFGL